MCRVFFEVIPSILFYNAIGKNYGSFNSFFKKLVQTFYLNKLYNPRHT